MVQRLTYRRRTSFNTKSNVMRKVKTPGGILKFQLVNKKAAKPMCGECGSQLIGVPAVRPKSLATTKKAARKVSRAYGGNLCGTCVKSRCVQGGRARVGVVIGREIVICEDAYTRG